MENKNNGVKKAWKVQIGPPSPHHKKKKCIYAWAVDESLQNDATEKMIGVSVGEQRKNTPRVKIGAATEAKAGL